MPRNNQRFYRSGACTMVLKPQTLRNLQIFTQVMTAATGFHCVFRVDYGPHEHVFSGLQRWYNNTIDDF
ncbi:unnamed protein product, partial [Discosporangium mesarthrocarpum]